MIARLDLNSMCNRIPSKLYTACDGVILAVFLPELNLTNLAVFGTKRSDEYLKEIEWHNDVPPFILFSRQKPHLTISFPQNRKRNPFGLQYNQRMLHRVHTRCRKPRRFLPDTIPRTRLL